MLRRLLVLFAVLGALAGLAGAAFVTFYERYRPAVEPPQAVDPGASAREVARAWGVRPGRGLFAPGYVQTWGAQFNGGHEAGDFEYGVIAHRGPLDRRAGTFPLWLRYASNTTGGLAEVRLSVAAERGVELDCSEAWDDLAVVVPLDRGGFSVAMFGAVDVPAESRLLRVVEVSRSGERWSHARSVPQAETWVGRLYDQWAWRVPFCWVPGTARSE